MPSAFATLAVWALFAVCFVPSAAVKLRISDVECVEKVIQEEDSLVSVVLVAGESEEHEVFFDFVARDPRSTVIFSKLAQNDAELAFKNRVSGRHSFCLTLSKRSRTRARVAYPVHLDIMVGQTWSHDKITDDHLDEMMGDVSDLAERVQKLRAEMRSFRFREARHRKTVESTSKRVLTYSVIKLAVIALIVVAQPLVLARLFRQKEKV